MGQRRYKSELGLPTGEEVRRHRILHRHGRGDATAPFRPYDQGVESPGDVLSGRTVTS